MQRLVDGVINDEIFLSIPPITNFEVVKVNGDDHLVLQDQLAEETPVALIYNGISHAVMLASPQDLEDFALGFSLSEGILMDKSELYGVDVQVQSNGIELHCEIASQRMVELKNHRRMLVGKTGCGLCGTESLAQAMHKPPKLKSKVLFKQTAVLAALKAMPLAQKLQHKTGATHACAWVGLDGNLVLVREDVGRHNALDKLIGAIGKLEARCDGFIITSSRASYEMVQNTATADVSMVVAISAPTALAVRTAKQCGLTLLGFARNNSYVIYSHPEHLN